jgi:hypothetical protein
MLSIEKYAAGKMAVSKARVSLVYFKVFFNINGCEKNGYTGCFSFSLTLAK